MKNARIYTFYFQFILFNIKFFLEIVTPQTFLYYDYFTFIKIYILNFNIQFQGQNDICCQ